MKAFLLFVVFVLAIANALPPNKPDDDGKPCRDLMKKYKVGDKKAGTLYKKNCGKLIFSPISVTIW